MGESNNAPSGTAKTPASTPPAPLSPSPLSSPLSSLPSPQAPPPSPSPTESSTPNPETSSSTSSPDPTSTPPTSNAQTQTQSRARRDPGNLANTVNHLQIVYDLIWQLSEWQTVMRQMCELAGIPKDRSEAAAERQARFIQTLIEEKEWLEQIRREYDEEDGASS